MPVRPHVFSDLIWGTAPSLLIDLPAYSQQLPFFGSKFLLHVSKIKFLSELILTIRITQAPYFWSKFKTHTH